MSAVRLIYALFGDCGQSSHCARALGSESTALFHGLGAVGQLFLFDMRSLTDLNWGDVRVSHERQLSPFFYKRSDSIGDRKGMFDLIVFFQGFADPFRIGRLPVRKPFEISNMVSRSSKAPTAFEHC